MPGPASAISYSAISGANRFNYHLCIVKRCFKSEDSCVMEVFICRSYREATYLVGYVGGLDHAVIATIFRSLRIGTVNCIVRAEILH
jgi:hypothetical protein